MKKYPIKNKFSSNLSGLFGVKRKHDIHTGIDLHCSEGTEIFALESGTVMKVSSFTGADAGSPWWNNTDYIGILSDSGYIVYGEVDSYVKEGQKITEGELLGKVKKVLKKDKGLPTSMLHLELYSSFIDEPVVWELNQPCPEKLKNPISLFNLPRFEHDASNFLELYNYIQNRSKQLIQENIKLESIDKKEYGAISYFIHRNQRYASIFLYPDFRNKGIYKQEITNLKLPVLTVNDCGIIHFLEKNKIKYLKFGNFLETNEYRLISKFYQDKKAKRSGIYLMNHIDEGLRVLNDIGASEEAKKAYCLHPLLQGDDDLIKNFNNLSFEQINPKALILAMEYRDVANEYLSGRKIQSIHEIRLSKLSEVNGMLIADKIQNYKDFLLYHQEHERYIELSQYFKNWFKKLKVTDDFFSFYLKELS